MADYCKACSIKIHGRDHGDLARLCKPGETVWELCEGCGDVVELDSEGRRATDLTKGSTPMPETKSLYECNSCNDYFHDYKKTSCPKCGSSQTKRVSLTGSNKWAENGIFTNLVVFSIVGGLFVLIALGIWGAYSWVSSQSKDPYTDQQAVKSQIIGRDNVRSALKDPDSAKFRGEFIGPSGAPCGEVNAKNGFGAYAGYQRYVASGGGLAVLEDQTGKDEFEQVWRSLCE